MRHLWQSSLKIKTRHKITFAFICLTTFTVTNLTGCSAAKMHNEAHITATDSVISPKIIAQDMQLVADWQIQNFRQSYSGRKAPHHIRDWTNGALYVGMLKWANLSNDPQYLLWLKSIAERGNWELHWRTYMADDHVVGQLYLDLYRQFGEPKMMAKTKERLDYIMQNPSTQPITLDKYAHLERWTWCDALFMGPPVWAKMSQITGEQKYNDWMFEEFKATTEHLYDATEGLFYRDNSFIGKIVNGEKVFWARGNGWVYAGLTLVMDELEPTDAHYDYYKQLYLKMTDTLLDIQTEQGHWAMSLLNAKTYPTPETSGTSFFTYGLAWGVNNGILPRQKVMPAIVKAYKALQSHVTDDGMLGYVQPIGAAPGNAWPDKTEVYGTGAFLAAGSEIYKLLDGPTPLEIAPSNKLSRAISIANEALDNEQSKAPQ
jgi:rhamnogalacturonyl hydrolase YesR